MSSGHAVSSRRVLEPIERISEVLFGLIMALAFTGTLSVVSDESEVRTTLVGALGCNLAWGLVDAIMYLMGCLAEKGRSRQTFMALRNAPDAQSAQQIIANALQESGIAHSAVVLRKPLIGALRDNLSDHLYSGVVDTFP